MRFAVLKQKHFYYKFNLRSKKNPFWYGTRICVKKYLKSPQWLRELKFKKRPFWRLINLDLITLLMMVDGTSVTSKHLKNYYISIKTYVKQMIQYILMIKLMKNI